MGLDPPYLGGREPELDRFQDLLGQSQVGRNMLVTGRGGVGQTELLNRSAAEAAGWLVAEGEFSDQMWEADLRRRSRRER